MTVGERIFHLLEEKHMSQKEFSDKTGIATTTISDWRKKNTNPGSDKIMLICSALGVSPEYLLSGVTEDSKRGKSMDYMVIPAGTDERELMDIFNGLSWYDRAHLLEYAQKMNTKYRESGVKEIRSRNNLVKIAEFCDIEAYMDSEFEGEPSLDINYIDDDVQGTINLTDGSITGGFSKYVLPVIEAWYAEHKAGLIEMWNSRTIELIEAWD